MPYIDWRYMPPPSTTHDVPWVVQVLSDGTMTVECDGEELSIPSRVVTELAEFLATREK